MNYNIFRDNSVRLVQMFGQPVKVTREGSTVAIGHGVFTGDNTDLDSGTPQLQTAIGEREVIVVLNKDPAVGDLLLADKSTYTIKRVERVRPSNLTIIHKLIVS